MTTAPSAPTGAVSLMVVTIRRASSRDDAEIVCSIVARAKSESESRGMRVSSYGVDSEMGPMSCWMPWKITTVSSSAPT